MQIEASDASHKVIEGAIYLLKKHYLLQPVRSIGISAGKLRPKDYQQLSLFEDVEEVKEQEALDKAVDKIRERYGSENSPMDELQGGWGSVITPLQTSSRGTG